MEQLGYLLLGFAVAGPTVLIIRGILTAGGEFSRPSPRNVPARRQRIAPLPRCDPKAVAEYFGSWLYGPKGDSVQPLSVPELTALLGGAAKDGLPLVVRFDGEGGYRLRL